MILYNMISYIRKTWFISILYNYILEETGDRRQRGEDREQRTKDGEQEKDKNRIYTNI
jgi:hypothetical protein